MNKLYRHLPRHPHTLPVVQYSWSDGNQLVVQVNSARFLCQMTAHARVAAVNAFYNQASRRYPAQNEGGLSLLIEPAGGGAHATPLAIANPGGAMLSAAGSSPTRC